MPAASSATMAASSRRSALQRERAHRLEFERHRSDGGGFGAQNVASRMRSRGIRAVSFVGCGQLHYARAVQHRSRAKAARDPYAHGDGGRVILQVHGVRKGGGLGRERAAAGRSRRRRRASQTARRRQVDRRGRSSSSCAPERADQLDALHQRFPPSLFEVLGVSGIGTKTAATLFAEYGIASLADLETAIAAGALAGVPRLGNKTIENWKRGILAYKGRQRRTPLAGRAGDRARSDDVRARRTAARASGVRRKPAPRRSNGRRHRSRLHVARTPPTSSRTSLRGSAPRPCSRKGRRRPASGCPGGLQIDLRVLPDHLYGNLLQHFTGSREHNIKLREHAVRASLRVSENGILNLETGEVDDLRR